MPTKPRIDAAQSAQDKGATINQQSQKSVDAIVDIIIALIVVVAAYFLLSSSGNTKSDFQTSVETLPSYGKNSQVSLVSDSPLASQPAVTTQTTPVTP